MVLFFEWHQTALDLKSSCGLPMTGEDSGLEASASPLAGYLEKVQGRASSLENCPWCTSKGLTYALRSYRINLQESITLCTNQQCLFPLVSRPLEDILASLVPVDSPVGTKRENTSTLEEEELKPSIKHPRLSELDDLGGQSDLETPRCPEKNSDIIFLPNCDHGESQSDCGRVNGFQKDTVAPEETEWEDLQNKDTVSENNPNDDALVSTDSVEDISMNTEVIEVAPLPHPDDLGMSDKDFKQETTPPENHEQCNSLQLLIADEDISSSVINEQLTQHEEQTMNVEQKRLPVDINTCNDSDDPKSRIEDLISVPNQLFWPNTDNLCWLDSLLAALVNCKSLRKCQPQDEPQKSSVWRLLREYEDICAAIREHQQTGEDGVVRISNHLLQKANDDLQSLRMSMFKMLEPKLHCRLGIQETPVFAMPLLLEMDSWAERVFKSWFYWDFQCKACKAATKVRIMKTLPTLTNLVPGWRPLDAVHKAPCNVCRKKNQQRTMVLERVPPVLALHFVDGLPDSDVNLYAFDFKGQHHSITTVIQYLQNLKHFVTWTRNSDGSWLEYDDLKHPHCSTHQTLRVPAEEMHVVFWEVEDGSNSHACSPSTTLTESSPSDTNKVHSCDEKDSRTDNALAVPPDQTIPHNDTDIVHALLVSDDSFIKDSAADEQTSIGADTLLDTFEGLTHNDIVTLTLVEVNPVQLLDGDQQTQVPICDEVTNTTPDSSLAEAVVNGETSHNSKEECPPTPSSPESVDDFSNDPSYVPVCRKGRGNTKGRNVNKQSGKKAPKDAPPTTVVAPSKPNAVMTAPPSCPTPENFVIPVELTQQTTRVSSTKTSPLPTEQHTSHSVSVTEARWSYLLSKHPIIQKSSIAPCAAPPRSAPPPRPPVHSTPAPFRRPPLPLAAFNPKPPMLRTEEGNTLPTKAATFYGSFGRAQPNHPANTTALSPPSPQTPGRKPNHDGSSVNKQSPKLPAGLTSTEALRHKLLKKLKAKKKKLAKLNMLIGDQHGVAGLQPDSTDLYSPSTVSSSTYDDYDILSDIISPATTASNFSPDSTEFLERLATGQDGIETAVPVPQSNGDIKAPTGENFLEDFLSQAENQRPTEMESEALSALELFI